VSCSLVPNLDSLVKVRNLSGEWISAPPIPGTFVCNIGDMLKVRKFGQKWTLMFVCFGF
jgi:hypothetical protein